MLRVAMVDVPHVAHQATGRARMRRAPKAPRRFLANVCAGLGGCELRRLLRSCGRPPRSALRVSRRRARPQLGRRLAREGFHLSPSPLSADGFFINVQETLSCQAPLLGHSLMHHSGEVYGQEATSTLPIESLRAVAEQTFGDQPLCVLDLCAAPGSKASQVASQLHIDLLVANEPQKTRAALLQANLLRAGVSEALILSMDGTRIGAIMPNAFDVVLVDAPCSGEGNIRKDPSAWDRWAHNDHPQQLQSRLNLQKDLMSSGWQALRPGGLLVYSTCTLNHEENERQCCQLQEQGAQVVRLDEQLVPSTPEGFLRVWPHWLDVEGFFVACFYKETTHVDPAAQMDCLSLGKMGFRRLKTSEVAGLQERVLQELHFSLPPGIPVMDKEEDVFLLTKRLPLLQKLLPHTLLPGIRLLSKQQISKELRLVAGGNLSSEEWLDLYKSAGGGLGASSLSLKSAVDAPTAWKAFQEMKQQRLEPDIVSYNTLLNAFAKDSDGAGAQEVFNEMTDVSVTPGVVSFSVLIEAHARAGHRKAAEQAFRIMQELGLQPNEVTYTALLRARLLSGDLLGAEDLQNELNVVGYTLLIDAYARVGNVEKAEAAVDALSMNAAPNLATYTALMKAYSRAHQLQGAEAVMSRMKAQGLEPNSITYVTLIAAHGKAKSLQRAEELYKEQGPNLASATAMIGAYGRAKDAERAQGVFDELCAQTVRPDAICCRQLSQALTGARPQSERKVYCKLQPSVLLSRERICNASRNAFEASIASHGRARQFCAEGCCSGF
ncbi:unnamed protein product, partial [Durusdinium trenchii]